MNRRGLKEASRQCIRDARYSAKRVTLVCLISIVALLALELGLEALLGRTSSSARYLSESISAGGRSYILTFLVSAVCQLLLAMIWAGYASVSLRLSRGEDFSLSTLLDGARQWSRTILLYLLESVMLTLWASVFSIPASYLLAAMYVEGTIDETAVLALLMLYMLVVMAVVSYRYRMAWFVLLDEPELSVRRVLDRTKQINKIHRGKLFRMDLSFLPWLLLSLLTCGVLLVWKLPYITATYAHAYNYMVEDLDRRQRQLAEYMEARRQRGNG